MQRPRQHRRPPHSASPGRGHAAGFPSRGKAPSHPLRHFSGQSGSLGVVPAHPHPGGGWCKLPRTKELSANDAELRGSAPSLLPQPGLKLSLRGGCPGRSRLRGQLLGPPSTDFSAAPGLFFPRLRADKSHACTRASETGRRQKPPDLPPNKEKGGKKARSIGEEKRKQRTRAGFPPPAPGSTHRHRSGPAPRRGRPAGSLTVRAGRGPSLLALAKSSRLPACVCRAHALLPAPNALYERLPGRRKSTCHFLNCLQLVPLTGFGQAASAVAGPPDRGCVNSAALCGRRRGPGDQRAATRCSARSRQWAGSGGGRSRRASGTAAGCPENPHRAPLTPGVPAAGTRPTRVRTETQAAWATDGQLPG